jgi:hypothetical protein
MLMYYFVIAAINFFVFLFVFRLDTPNYYNKKNDQESNSKRYKALLDIYHIDNVMGEIEILEKLKSTVKPIKKKDLLTKSFWILNGKAIVIGIFIANLSHLVGANIINILSTSII